MPPQRGAAERPKCAKFDLHDLYFLYGELFPVLFLSDSQLLWRYAYVSLGKVFRSAETVTPRPICVQIFLERYYSGTVIL